MKIFIICSSEFLPAPPDRDPNSIYLLYDTLDVYYGRTQYSGLYSIVTELPDGSSIENMPVKNMMYIKMNGDVYMVNEETPELIAQLEDPSQAEYLVKAGTSFLLKSGYRYIDSQTKVLSLPFQNGIFQLSVILDKPIEITNETILVYNPETGHFEIDGPRYYDEFGRNPEILKYTAKETNTVKTYIQNDHIHADVKVSGKVGNILQIRTDGLYANSELFASVEEFNELVTRTQREINTFNIFLQRIEDAMASVDITLSDTTLREAIEAAIEEHFPTLEEAVDNYEEVIEQFHHTVEELVAFISTNIVELKEDTVERIEDVHTSWGYFVDNFDTVIEKVEEGSYKLTVPFDPDTSHKLYYKLGEDKIYFEAEQDISDLGMTEFENNDVISANIGDEISIAYCNISTGSPIITSCSYCIAE